MASLFNSKHNKYFSTPDWFKDTVFDKKEENESQTIYMSGGSGGSAKPGLSDIYIYNKFVLEQAELNNEALVHENIVLITIESEEQKIGDEFQLTGWSTTDLINVAGGSTMTITSKIIEELNEQYGIIFYDHSVSSVNVHYLTSAQEEVVVPSDAYYFRISTPSDYEEFKINYFVSTNYKEDQLSLSNLNVSDFLSLDETIPEGINETTFQDTALKLLVQPPLSLIKDNNNVVKISIDQIDSDVNKMFNWDKRFAAFGYDADTNKAYSYIDGEQQFAADGSPIMTNNPDFWMYDEKLQDKWIIKTSTPKFSILDGLIEYDSEKDSFIFHKNIITSGSVVMYADLDDINVNDIYDGLVTDATIVRDREGVFGVPIDNETLVLKDGKIIVSENISGQAEWGKIKYKPAWLEDGQISYDEVVGLTDLLKGFVTTTGEEQDVYGIKNFKNGIKINNLFIKNSQSDVIYIDANLVVRGGITMYAVDPVTVPSIIDSLPPASTSSKGVASFNSEYFSVNNGHVTLIHENIGLNRDELNSILDSKGYATQSQITTQVNELRQYVTENYVTITGEDTITGKKNFTGGLFVNNHQIVYDTDGEYWKLDGNLVVTGGITMYSNAYNDDPGSGGGIDEEAVRNLIESYNYVTVDDLYTFDASDFSISGKKVSLNTHIVTRSGTPLSYNANTLYIIL